MSDEPSEHGMQGVTSVISHTVKPGAEAEYEAWLKNLANVGHTFTGNQGANIIRPAKGSSTYTIILRFDTVEHLQAYLNSDIRNRLVKEVRPLLAQKMGVDIRTGLDFWFTPPTSPAFVVSSAPLPQVKPYKQFLVILSAIFPLTIAIHWLLSPLAEAVPFFGQEYIRDLLDAIIVVASLTFVIMPHYTRILAKWLYD
jgi:antibiotic biosynthesis monooxygenase (ABM) superfamily enzyme